MGRKYIYKWITFTVIILPLFFLIQTTGLQTASAVDYEKSENHQTSKRSELEVTKNQTEKTLTHEEVIDLTNKFMDLLVQETDDRFKVNNYNTKDELLDAFEKIVSRDEAARYVDFYYREKAGGLYIIPTETPPWLNNENDYDMIQLGDNKVKVVQENKSNFHGDYTVTFEFTYKDKWKITNIVYS